jgi:outer membrane lipoprotein SlyB
MKKTIAALVVAAAALSGCATTDALTNRVACTVGKDKAYFLSLYGPVGVSAEVDKRDAEVICK